MINKLEKFSDQRLAKINKIYFSLSMKKSDKNDKMALTKVRATATEAEHRQLRTFYTLSLH